jgi:hypothetical protein
MGGAYSMHVERKCTFKVLVGIFEGKKTLEIRERIISRWIFRKWVGGMD